MLVFDTFQDENSQTKEEKSGSASPPIISEYVDEERLNISRPSDNESVKSDDNHSQKCKCNCVLLTGVPHYGIKKKLSYLLIKMFIMIISGRNRLFQLIR